MKSLLLISVLYFVNFSNLNTQETIYDESKVPEYILPELLIGNDGHSITSVESWENSRRREIISFFEKHVYGKNPGEQIQVATEIIEKGEYSNIANCRRKQIKFIFKNNGRSLEAILLVYLPKHKKNIPVFLGYNFYGNHTISPDGEIIISDSWVRDNENFKIFNSQADANSRGVRSHRWAVKNIIESGYGLATMYYGDIDPDKNDFTDGIHPLFYKKDQVAPNIDEWGSIGAWAWGLSQILNYLESDPDINSDQVIAFGHSRLGKASLWAGAMDERFEIVISNNSGCGGAALFKRKFGETVATINQNFPHWFNSNFKNYNNNEEALPIDQHMLISLIAPRPVYVASAEDDQWADPRGEYLSAFHASPVFRLYQKEGFESTEPPATNRAIHNQIGYHRRTGKHDVTEFDWTQYLKFANYHFNKK